jgi:hypothetical protein
MIIKLRHLSISIRDKYLLLVYIVALVIAKEIKLSREYKNHSNNLRGNASTKIIYSRSSKPFT